MAGEVPLILTLDNHGVPHRLNDVWEFDGTIWTQIR